MVEVRITDLTTGASISQLDVAAIVEIRLAEINRTRVSPGDEIPWWSYDEQQGLWIQEGVSEIVEDDNGTLWARAHSAHFSWWNCDQPFDSHACVKLEFHDDNGNPISDLNIFNEGVSYSGGGPNYRASFDGQAYCSTVKRSSATEVSTYRMGIERDGVAHYFVETTTGGFSLTTEPADARVFEASTANASCLYGLNLEQCDDLGVVEVDLNRAPVLTLTASATATCTESVTVSATVVDPDGDAVTASWSTPQGGTLQNLTPTVVEWAPPASAGAYTIEIVAVDAHGRSVERSVNVDVSDSATSDCCPVIQDIDVPAAIDPQSTPIVELSAAIVDDGVSPVTYRWEVGGEVFETAESSFDWTVEGVGEIDVVLVVADSGCEARRETTLVVDNERPVIDALIFDRALLACGDETDFEVQASDADGDPLSYAWTWNGEPLGSDATTQTVAAIGSGIRPFKVVVSDPFGGAVTGYGYTLIDNDAPTLEIASEQAGATTEFVATAADDGTISTIDWSVTSGTIVASGNEATWTAPDGDDTSAWLNVAVHDDCGGVTRRSLRLVGGSEISFCAVPEPRVENAFRRGDVNGDGSIGLADAITLGSFLGLGPGPGMLDGSDMTDLVPSEPTVGELSCYDAADLNDDGCLTADDFLGIINAAFITGFAPPAPGFECGQDPTADDLDCAIGSCD